jgi:phosphoglycerol transferase
MRRDDPALAGRSVTDRTKSATQKVVPYAVTALICVLLLFSFFHLWGRDLETPIDPPGGDSLLSAALAKEAMTGASVYELPQIGAPFGLKFYDFPMAENLHLLFFRVCGLFAMRPLLAINLFYLAGYVLISLTSLYLFRSLHLPLLPSISASLLVAFLPHHWMRGEYHLFLSAYYVVPLMVLVLIRVAQGVPLVAPAKRRGIRGYAPTADGWFSLVVCLAMGSGGVYYALFAVFFLLIAGLYSMRRAGWRVRVAEVGILFVALGTSFASNMLPSALYFMQYGRNAEVAKRYFFEADVYALKIAGLLLPIQNHRIASWAQAKVTYITTETPYVPQNDLTAALGLAGGAGFLLLLGYSFAAASVRKHNLLAPLGVFNLAALLLATVGGFCSLFAYFISPQLRCYHRISVYISLFSLTALLVAVQWLAEKRPWGLPSAWIARAAAVLLFVGIWDITPVFADRYPANRQWLDDTRAFIGSIERSTPAGSMIFQLPYLAFPEGGGVGQMLDYEPLRGSLFSDRLRWSYGAVRGRPEADFAKEVSGLAVPQMIERLRAKGFRGVYLDRKGYADFAVEVELTRLLGRKEFEDSEHRLIYFSLDGRPTSPEQTSAADELPVVAAVADCYGHEPNGNSWCSNSGKVVIVNPNRTARHALLTFEVYAAMPAASRIRMSGALAEEAQIGLGAPPRLFARELDLPPGRTVIALQSDGKALVSASDPRNKVFAILNLRVQKY